MHTTRKQHDSTQDEYGQLPRMSRGELRLTANFLLSQLEAKADDNSLQLSDPKDDLQRLIEFLIDRNER
jgi:hypothetical protein